MGAVLIVIQKWQGIRSISFSVAVFFSIMMLGCIPRESKGVDLKDEASRVQLVEELARAKIAFTVDEDGVVWFDPKDEDAVNDAIAKLDVIE